MKTELEVKKRPSKKKKSERRRTMKIFDDLKIIFVPFQAFDEEAASRVVSDDR